MAGSVNKVIVLGNLGAAPELKYIPSGQAVCEMRVATSESYQDKHEQWQERTEWHRIKVWGKLAENCAKYLGKGSKLYAEGKLQTRSWEDKEGKTQYMTEVVCHVVVFLTKPSEKSGEGGGAPPAPRPSAPAGGGQPPVPGEAQPYGEDDIPF